MLFYNYLLIKKGDFNIVINIIYNLNHVSCDERI